jgi:hypothetical protein
MVVSIGNHIEVDGIRVTVARDSQNVPQDILVETAGIELGIPIEAWPTIVKFVNNDMEGAHDETT